MHIQNTSLEQCACLTQGLEIPASQCNLSGAETFKAVAVSPDKVVGTSSAHVQWEPTSTTVPPTVLLDSDSSFDRVSDTERIYYISGID